ncbi:hypothetical protein TNCV_4131801 [Trichonephila clavipes]|nr:hypothetical protein TNCV_4131801 [Trichonephila clavipes]
MYKVAISDREAGIKIGKLAAELSQIEMIQTKITNHNTSSINQRYAMHPINVNMKTINGVREKRQFDHLVHRHHHPVRGLCQDPHQLRYESDSSSGSCAWILSNSLLNKTFPIQQSETVPIPYGDHVRKQSDRNIELYRLAKCTEASGSEEQAVASRLFTHRGLLMIVTEFANRLEEFHFQ